MSAQYIKSDGSALTVENKTSESERRCLHCLKIKPTDDFPTFRNRGGKLFRRNVCRPCKSIQNGRLKQIARDKAKDKKLEQEHLVIDGLMRRWR